MVLSIQQQVQRIHVSFQSDCTTHSALAQFPRSFCRDADLTCETLVTSAYNAELHLTRFPGLLIPRVGSDKRLYEGAGMRHREAAEHWACFIAVLREVRVLVTTEK